MKKSVVIGIAGPSGSGKSTLAEALAASLKQEVTVVHADSFYKPAECFPKLQSPLTGEMLDDWNTPDAIDFPALEAALLEAEGAGGVVLAEGAFLFCFPALLRHFDLRVYTTAPIETRLYRRIRRNMAQRGLSMEEIADYYLQAARFSEGRNTLAVQHLADFIVHTEGDLERQIARLCILIEAMRENGK